MQSSRPHCRHRCPTGLRSRHSEDTRTGRSATPSRYGRRVPARAAVTSMDTITLSPTPAQLRAGMRARSGARWAAAAGRSDNRSARRHRKIPGGKDFPCRLVRSSRCHSGHHGNRPHACDVKRRLPVLHLPRAKWCGPDIPSPNCAMPRPGISRPRQVPANPYRYATGIENRLPHMSPRGERGRSPGLPSGSLAHGETTALGSSMAT